MKDGNDSFVIGLDLGGTDLKAALVRRDGSLEGFLRRASRTLESRDAPLDVAAAAAAELRSVAPGAAAVGLGCPGPIDPVTGAQAGATAHLPHWRELPVQEEMERRIGLPVVVDNDANLAALAEHRVGAARGTRVSITVTLGTGIGCGIVVDGRILRGARGGAGELGHVPLGRSDGEPCACGVPDCVEPQASASGLLVRARASGIEAAGVPDFFQRAREMDPRAHAILEAMCDRLGATIATAVQIVNPEVVVVGGRVAEAGEVLFEPLRAAVRRYALASHARELRIEPAALGERAGTVGAGLLAWERAAVRT